MVTNPKLIPVNGDEWTEAFPSLALQIVLTGFTVRLGTVNNPAFELVKALTGPVEDDVVVI